MAIFYNESKINDWNYDESNINKVYYNSSVIYQKIVTGDTPTPPTPPHDYSLDYLTFTAIESGTFNFSCNGLSYSVDDGTTWTNLAANTNTPTVSAGNKILFKGQLQSNTCVQYGVGQFGSSGGKFDIEGNIMSIIYGDNFIGQTTFPSGTEFDALFTALNVVSAENLILPATALTEYCYNQMFYNCTSLTTAPELPATALATSCYYEMFYNCTSLTTAPELPATTMAEYCYRYMFSGCTSLTTAPELPATTLVWGCYQCMFNGCTSLTTAPELPATTLATLCYDSMFRGCTSLTTAPSLPATTLASNCYNSMFYNCTSLNSITCLATDISATNCTLNWVNGVAANGTFTKAASMTSWPTGDSGIPTNWTIVDYTG